jgi:hypothetical protein
VFRLRSSARRRSSSSRLRSSSRCQSLALHLQFHLRILFEDLRVSLAKPLCEPLVGYASGTQSRAYVDRRSSIRKWGTSARRRVSCQTVLKVVWCRFDSDRSETRTDYPPHWPSGDEGFNGYRSEGYFGGTVWSFRVGNPDDRILKVRLILLHFGMAWSSCAAQLCQLPIFLIAPRGVCRVPSLLMSKS